MTELRQLPGDKSAGDKSGVYGPQGRHGGLRFGLRKLLLLITVLAVLLAVVESLYRNHFQKVWESDVIRSQLVTLVDRRPPDVSPLEWEAAVGWTLNLHGNSMLQFQADAGEIQLFRTQLETQLASEVDLNTIEWIWDQYAVLCRGGRDYQRFREVMHDQIRTGRGGGWPECPLSEIVLLSVESDGQL